MNECIFCRIASGDVESEIVASSEEWIAFRDLSPQAPTHVLVIPREHAASLDALEDEHDGLAGRLLLACREVARLERLDGGYRVVTNIGADGGQSVAHLHLHVLGGRALGWPPG